MELKIFDLIRKSVLYFGLWWTMITLSACNLGISGDDEAKTEDYPKTENWWTGKTFYTVFVRSFYDSNGDGIGDLRGVKEKLDYLNDGNPSTNSDLGVTALMLLPVFSSVKYDGSDVDDYRKIHPDLGTADDLNDLIAAAHLRGMKVVVGLEINHTSAKHPWFKESASSADSPKRKWYVWSNTNPGFTDSFGRTVWHPSEFGFYYGYYGPEKPDLNFREDAVTAEMKDAVSYWHDKTDVDGFRMGSAGLLIEEDKNLAQTKSTLEWWRKFYPFQRNVDPALLTIGEIFSATTGLVSFTGDKLDYCMEYSLAEIITEAIETGNNASIRRKLTETVNTLPNQQFGVLLSDHNRQRAATVFDGDKRKSKAAATLMLTLPGIPHLYYGEEIDMKGGAREEDVRSPMQWNSDINAGFSSAAPWLPVKSDFGIVNVRSQTGDSTSMLEHYRRLIGFRNSFSAFQNGNYEPVNTNSPALFAFLRTGNKESLLVIQNLSGASIREPVLSITDGSLGVGAYETTELQSGKASSILRVNQGGSFSGFIPAAEVAPFQSLILKLVPRLE
ncbi:MAG: alpha-amylase [Bacteroidetes bacterium]|nr:alpha-amylase [Bacteroidota bacterium]